jgi:hypothetical protein
MNSGFLSSISRVKNADILKKSLAKGKGILFEILEFEK